MVHSSLHPSDCRFVRMAFILVCCLWRNGTIIHMQLRSWHLHISEARTLHFYLYLGLVRMYCSLHVVAFSQWIKRLWSHTSSQSAKKDVINQNIAQCSSALSTGPWQNRYKSDYENVKLCKGEGKGVRVMRILDNCQEPILYEADIHGDCMLDMNESV